MHSGLFYGYAGLVSNIIEKMKKGLGKEAAVIATGGFATLLGEELEDINFIEPHLVLEGLHIIFEKNKSDG